MTGFTFLTNKYFSISKAAIPVLASILFFLIVLLYFPFREKIQFDTDEGLNLMRSMLVSMNHPLYSEVSSDQPPLFTYLLVFLFKFTGFEVNPARILVLFFSTLLIWSCAQTIQIIWGNLAAAMFMPIMILAPRYIQLSASVMIGLPSISLVCLSILVITIWYDNKLDRFLFLSGCFLALSGLIKLFKTKYYLDNLILLCANYSWNAISWIPEFISNNYPPFRS